MKWGYLLSLAVMLLGCTATPPAAPPPIRESPALSTPAATRVLPATEIPTPRPTPAPAPPVPSPSDTTPPPTIAGLVANNAYDKRVNLWWDRSAAPDFDHYNIYVSKAEMTDVTGMNAVKQMPDVTTTRYQVTGLEDGTKYYFAVTAIDRSGNENRRASSVSATPAPMPRGTTDPDLQVDVYQADMAWAGTTLLPDNHNRDRPRIVEVNMLGEIVWQYVLPQDFKRYTNPGFDVELLPGNSILMLLPGKGVYEIDRSGKILWSYLDRKVSHDADRLPNGNTLMVYGADDRIDDAQVKEVNPGGEVVWTWYARDHFNRPPYKDIYEEGWLHTNAVTRLSNGNTLISPRNFDFLVEVSRDGSVVRTIGEGILDGQHDPEMLPNGNILIANHSSPQQPRPHRALELDPSTGNIVWQSPPFPRETFPVRDANRLPNGNTLITGSTLITEVTRGGKIVWRLKLKDIVFQTRQDASGRGFYKAERISAGK